MTCQGKLKQDRDQDSIAETEEADDSTVCANEDTKHTSNDDTAPESKGATKPKTSTLFFSKIKPKS